MKRRSIDSSIINGIVMISILRGSASGGCHAARLSAAFTAAGTLRAGAAAHILAAAQRVTVHGCSAIRCCNADICGA